ncbi:hypothetical protein [Mesorhizobium sp.]|uniref:hypothetical protein n=1 Tax=Mesorhizobium sp. TaxID=1871066 RepID=UPI000FE81C3F|nr:hypothetical protein [Mesorhizobium sp.]RWB59015.1 MAG: hypothetical protein EOQ47_07685 [Mesorhizobium sp.]
MIAQRIHINVLRHPVHLLQSKLRHAVLQRVDRLFDGADRRQETRDIVVAVIVLRVDGDRALGPLEGAFVQAEIVEDVTTIGIGCPIVRLELHGFLDADKQLP